MSTSEVYRAQVALLLRVLPLIDEESSFALKGGTAINLFVRDLPRLSVDIDLTYLPVEDRQPSLAQIDAALGRITARVRTVIPGSRVQLFDVRDLFAHEGITDELRRAFVAYVVSHPRPIAEVLSPRLRDLRQEYESGFVGMTLQPVTLEELISVRAALIAEVVGEMPDAHRRFLLSFKSGEPDWDLLDLPEVRYLPAVRWKVDNLAKLVFETTTTAATKTVVAVPGVAGGVSIVAGGKQVVARYQLYNQAQTQAPRSLYGWSGGTTWTPLVDIAGQDVIGLSSDGTNLLWARGDVRPPGNSDPYTNLTMPGNAVMTHRLAPHAVAGDGRGTGRLSVFGFAGYELDARSDDAT